MWVLQAALAAVFAGAGLTKLGGSPEMVQLFADIGAGQPLRYVVGALEVAGAAGLLVPRLAAPAAVGLTALMAGATVTNVVVLGVGPAMTLGLLAAAGVVAWRRRDRLRAPLRR
ncbi:DoxX family membrane protein [Modestobacter lapidis]|nr:DoxX family membrane protein [Modestobacter lapidis]